MTSEGPSGLFINPTSGTAPKGTITAETCVAIFEAPDGSTFVGNKILASYGITDWLELGGLGLDIQNDTDDASIGPFCRARLWRDEKDKPWPEVCVGSYALLSQGSGVNPALADKGVLFAAASKEIPLPERSGIWKAFKGVRLHGGVRNAWRNDAGDGTDFVGYFGGEIELPHWIYLIGEVQSSEYKYPYQPFAFGVQVRHPAGVGFSLGGMQPGFSSDIGLYVGIGIGFSW